MKKLILIFAGIVLLGACFKPSPDIPLDGDWIVSRLEFTDNCDSMAGLVGLAFIHDSTLNFHNDFLFFDDETYGFRYGDTLYKVNGEKAVIRFKEDTLILDGDIIYFLYKMK